MLNGFFSSVCSTYQILSNRWYPTVFVNMMSANSCLELNFITHFIRYWQYSRHISLKICSNEINVIFYRSKEFEWNSNSNGILFRMFCFCSVSFFYFIFIVQMEGATTSHKGEKISSYTISFKLEVVEFAEDKSITAELR